MDLPLSGNKRRSLSWPVFTLLAVVLVAAGVLLGDAFRAPAPDVSHSVDAGDSSAASSVGGDFTLRGAGGRDVSLAEFRGNVVMLYFGYTYCPDLCPQYLQSMKMLRAALGDSAQRFRVILISLDPARDTPERLDEYVRFFDESFVGLTGSRAQIDRVVEAFGAAYSLRSADASGNYLVDHTSLGYLIDGTGQVRHVFAHTTDLDQQLELVRELIAQP